MWNKGESMDILSLYNQLDEVLKLNIKWKSPEILVEAMTHTSYLNNKKTGANNQRLEFLGDAVLELVISDYLYTKFAGLAEGELTRARASIVCEGTLAEAATELNLGQALLIGKGEEKTGGRNRTSILADAFESLVGAIYLDQGLESAKSFILRKLERNLGGDFVIKNKDFKTTLQEYVQGIANETVTYSVLSEEGPDHDKTFRAGVYFKEKLMGTGQGKNKKEAEQKAAYDALKQIKTI
jgi:ribonuclease III